VGTRVRVYECMRIRTRGYISVIAVLLNNVKTSVVLGAVLLRSYVVLRIFLHILYMLVQNVRPI